MEIEGLSAHVNKLEIAPDSIEEAQHVEQGGDNFRVSGKHQSGCRKGIGRIREVSVCIIMNLGHMTLGTEPLCRHNILDCENSQASKMMS